MSDLRSRIHRVARGQALAEFALILPLLLGIVGGGIDFARAFEGAMTLQTATRNAAEAAAFSADNLAEAQAKARAVVCTETQRLPGFVPGLGGDVATCTSPSVSVTYARSTTAPGANARYPFVSVTVTTSHDFDLIVPWPLLPSGGWNLGTTESFGLMQGR
jgi:Flp pilus assembly protein TadG